MKAEDISGLMEQARAYQIEFWLDGERVRMRAPEPPPPAVLEQLRAFKPQLVATLQERTQYRLFRFLLDGNSVNAIRPEGMTLAAMRKHLTGKFGPGRVSEVVARSAILTR